VVLQALFTGKYLFQRLGKAKQCINYHVLKIKCYCIKSNLKGKGINSPGPFLAPCRDTTIISACFWNWYRGAEVLEQVQKLACSRGDC